MILLKRKNLEDIIKNLRKFDTILVARCSGCTSVYGLMNKREVEKFLDTIQFKMPKKVIKTESIPKLCDKNMVKNRLSHAMEEYEAILSVSCGVGVQTLAETFEDIPVFPANDTMFLGEADWENSIFREKCVACGDCILDKTGGICPKTRCPKGLLNGPCGGQYEGKCEVGGYVRECAWILIWKKLRKIGKTDLLKEFKFPRDYRKESSPRELRLAGDVLQ